MTKPRAISTPASASLIADNAPLFLLAFEESAIPKALIGLDGRILKANRAACEWLNYSESEFLMMTFYDATHPDDVLFTANTLQSLMDGKKPSVWMEKRYIRKDGAVVWGLVSTVLIRAADGSPLYRLSEIQDITERKLAEEALRKSEAKFRAVLDNSNDGIILVNAANRVIYRSASTARMNAFTNEERLGHDVLEVVHPDEQARLRELLDQVRQSPGKLIKVEFRARHADGHWLWVEAKAQNLLANPDVQAVVINIQDVTERKLADEALRRSDAKFRAVVENIKDGILFYNAEGIILYQSPATTAIHGYSADERLGCGFDLPHPDDLPRVRQVWLETLHTPDASRQVEFRVRHKSGEWRWIESNVYNFLGNPDVQSVVVSNRDITERRQAEEALRHNEKEARRLSDQLRMVNEMMLNLTSGLDIELLMQKLHEQCQRIGSIDTFFVLLYDEKTNLLSSLYNVKDGERRKVPVRNIRENPGLTGYVIEHPHTLYLPDSLNPPAGLPDGIRQPGKQTRTIVIVPLVLREKTIGVLSMQNNSPNAYTPEQVETLELLAPQVAIAIHNSQLYEQQQNESNLANALVENRSRELQTIYRVAASANPRLELQSVIQGALEIILPAIHAPAGAVLLWNESEGHFRMIAAHGLPVPAMEYLKKAGKDSLECWVLENRRPLVLADAATNECIPFKHTVSLPFAVLPMLVGERAVGVLDVGRAGSEPFNLEELTLLDFIADHLGLVVENAQLFRQVENHAVLEERSRMARALHDSVTQLLYSAMLYAEGSVRLAEQSNWKQVSTNLGELSSITRQALQEMRLMVYELRSPALHHDGLVQAIQHRLDAVETRSGIQAAILADPLPRLPERAEESLYRIAIEALNNSLKHSHAKNVTVFLRRSRRKLLLCIRDDGIGFDVDGGTTGGLGLVSMKERVEHLGGCFSIHSHPGAGCEVEAVIPRSVVKNLRRTTE